MTTLTIDPQRPDLLSRATRTYLTEDQWATLCDSPGIREALPAGLAPAETGPELVGTQRRARATDQAGMFDTPETESTLRQTLALITGGGLRVCVGSSRKLDPVADGRTGPSRGVLAWLFSDLHTVLSVVRRMHTDERTHPMAGVEVTVTRFARFTAEIMRLLPGDTFTEPTPVGFGSGLNMSAPHDNTHRSEPVRSPIDVPAELSIGLAQAIRTGDHAMTRAICTDQGWPGVPQLLQSLILHPRGFASIDIRNGWLEEASTRHWHLCAAGWVGISAAPHATLRHTLTSREDIRDQLTRDLVGTLTRLGCSGATPGNAAQDDQPLPRTEQTRPDTSLDEETWESNEHG